MKMNYRLIRNVRGKTRLDLWFPLVFLVTVALFHFAYPIALGALASRVAAPFWKMERYVGDQMRHTFSLLVSKQALVKDVERLSLELSEAHQLLLDRDILREENRILKEQLGRRDKEGSRIIGAVLSAPPRSLYDTLVLDIGAADGVAAGDAALSGSLILGLVSKVYHTTSVIELFSTAGRKTHVSILHDGMPIPAEAVGEGGEAFRTALPKDVSVRVGDTVVLPGLNPFIFARVEAIEGSITDSLQIIRFKSPVPLRTLRFLEVRHRVSEEWP